MVQNRVTNDPEFAAAMRDTLPLIWQAASYPIRDNEDWRVFFHEDVLLGTVAKVLGFAAN